MCAFQISPWTLTRPDGATALRTTPISPTISSRPVFVGARRARITLVATTAVASASVPPTASATQIETW